MSLRCCLIAGLSVLTPMMSVCAQTLPTGFAVQTMASGFLSPIALMQLPDGRMLVVEQRTHLVKVVVNGTASTVGMIPGVSNAGLSLERGIQHATIDPAWPARPYLYVWYNHAGTSTCWLSMFTMQGDLSDPASTNLVIGPAYAILTDIPDVWDIHNGGALRFGADGFLYLSTGDDFSDECDAQDPTTGLGCILRLDVASLPGPGSGPPAKTLLAAAGNPYPTLASFGPLTLHHGLRNPWRFDIRPGTSELMIADVGDMSFEEISNATGTGRNFGWPYFEGLNVHAASCAGPPANPTPPIVEIAHSAGSLSITSLGFYTNPPGGSLSFGPAYEGNYFYGDFITGFIRRMVHNGTTWVPAAPVPGQASATNWGDGFQFITDTLVGQDGALYFLNHGVGSLERIKATNNTISIVLAEGDGQAVNAGTAAMTPLAVRAVTQFGGTVANIPVTFTLSAGSGTLPTQAINTGVDGRAVATFIPSTMDTTNPVIIASSPGMASVTFNLEWRGLVATYSPGAATISLSVRHSQTSSPFVMAVEPGPSSSVLTSLFGVVTTSVLAPLPGLVLLDGIGLYGPGEPAFVTRPDLPRWDLALAALPIFGGITVHAQVYSIDSQRLPAPDAFFISNSVDLILN